VTCVGLGCSKYTTHCECAADCSSGAQLVAAWAGNGCQCIVTTATGTVGTTCVPTGPLSDACDINAGCCAGFFQQNANGGAADAGDGG
jgi:hypothetical protein